MPKRLPPYVLSSPHEAVGTKYDVDWTLNKDWDLELRLREERNKLIKEQLVGGSSVCYRSSGNSLSPQVRSNDCCTYEPVKSADDVNVWDIVFCRLVRPVKHFYAHYVKHKEWRAGGWVFTISNKNGHVNGDTDIDHIYGILVSVHR